MGKGYQSLNTQPVDPRILEQLLSRQKLGLVLQSSAGKILYANPEARRLLGEALEHMDGEFAFHPNWRPVDEAGREFKDQDHPARAALRGLESPAEVVIGMRAAGKNEYHWIRMGAIVLQATQEESQSLVCTTFLDISAQKQAEQSHLNSEQANERLINAHPDPTLRLDLTGRVQAANQAAEALFHLPVSELIGQEFSPLAFPTDQQPVSKILDALRQSPQAGGARRWVTRLNEAHWVEWTLTPLFGAQGQAAGLLAVGHDLSDQRRLEEALQRANLILGHTQDGVMITDAENRIISVNEAFTRITGYKAHEVIGRNPALLNSGRQDGEFYRSMWQMILSNGRWQGQIWNRRKDGEIYSQWLTVLKVPDQAGAVQYIGIFTASLQEKQLDDVSTLNIHTDPLTELPNRLLFVSRLDHALRQAAHQKQQLGLLYVDLDNFKDINDSMGYAAGDRLLVEVSRRLKSVLSDTDTLSRIGGDEFVILLENVPSTTSLTNQVYQLKECFIHPFFVNREEVYSSASIGISLYPKDGESIDRLLKNAAAAARRAKRAGRNTYQFYTSGLNASSFERMVLVSKLRRALEKGELYLYYQPFVHIASGRMAGAEALLRWRNPDLGLIAPLRFIPLAEESGQIRSIGAWVLEQACKQYQEWKSEGLEMGRVAVNVAQLQFQRPDFPDTVRAALQASGMDPHRLVLEVTESSMMADMKQALEVLHALRGMGIKLAIDDFGTGYSSLAYLKNLPIDILKLDQSFVIHLPAETGNLAITRAVIAMGKALKLEVLAEGVETDLQREILLREGCHFGQGFYFCPPVEPTRIHTMLAKAAGNI